VSGAVEAKLAELGLSLPDVVPPLAAYQPAVRSGVYVYTAGQLPMVDGKLPVTGKVGAEVTAVRRGSDRIEPTPETALRAGDVVVLRGTGNAVTRAEGRLLR